MKHLKIKEMILFFIEMVFALIGFFLFIAAVMLWWKYIIILGEWLNIF